MRKLYLIGLFAVISNTLSAQTGKITGKVINAGSGQALSSATLVLIEKSRSETADQNGNFIFNRLPAGTYSIKCSYAGHLEKIVEEIIVKDNENTVITISLAEKKSDAVVITSTRVRAVGESVASLLIAQKNNASVSDGITAESIRKTPDKSTSDVLKRVSGASIQDDRFAIIRGLNDRYNAAFINGAPLPSTESDRKAFAFDIFPSAILDNLVIYKTATPDKSGEFAGGLIDITTKAVIQKNFTSLSFGMGYNSLSTGKDRYYSANKGKTDWLGLDDGTRAIPSTLPSSNLLKSLTFALRADFAKHFRDYKWGILQGNTSPNFNFQLSQGFNVEKDKKEFFGALFSVNYNRNYSFVHGDRNSYEYDMTAPAIEPEQRGKLRDSAYNDEVVLSALANFSIKINNRNSISWKNNLSINTDNKLLKRQGPSDYTSDPDIIGKNSIRWYTSNKIVSSQLGGEHLAGPIKTKINWLASYSKVQREIPNLSVTGYSGVLPNLSANLSTTNLSQGGSGTMFFTNSNENIKNIKTDITQPYKFMKNSQNFVKIGAGYQIRKRAFTSRLLGFSPYRNGVVFDNTLLQLPEEKIFLPEHLGKMTNGKGGFLLNDGTLQNSNYDASSALTHAYIMNDQRFYKKYRMIYGLRMEKFNQKLSSIKNLRDTININNVVKDFLPSVNFVYSLTSKINLRLSFAKTINRPEFRELAPYLFLDNATQITYEGFDTLQRATVKNYDFRVEFYPGRAQLFSVSAFYKEFTNPIEIVSNPVFKGLAIYSNAKSAKVYGLEAEFRVLISTILGIKREDAFLSKFTLAANGAYTKSKVVLGGFGFFDPALLVTDRALQGQSPYIINGSLGFNDEKKGFSSTLSVNRVGDRILIAGTVISADIYERARTVVDFQVAKFFLKNKLEIRLTAKDILSQKINYYFDFDKSRSYTAEKDRYFSSTVVPKVFSFNATYKF